jgi:hypothetical protein
MRLGDQLARGEAERLLQLAELFIAWRIGDAARLDQRKVWLGDAGAAGQLVEGKTQTTALSAKFGA